MNVRLLHALARRMCLESGKWDVKDIGLPLSQGNMVGTLSFFCQVPIEAMRMRGIYVSPEETEQAWQVRFQSSTTEYFSVD